MRNLLLSLAGFCFLIFIVLFTAALFNNKTVVVIGYNRPQGVIGWSFVLAIILFGCSFIFRKNHK